MSRDPTIDKYAEEWFTEYTELRPECPKWEQLPKKKKDIWRELAKKEKDANLQTC